MWLTDGVQVDRLTGRQVDRLTIDRSKIKMLIV